jgi:hypothetical protein
MRGGSAERNWAKSRRCDTYACVEVALNDDGAAMRNTVDPETMLSFGVTAWQDFIAAIKDGEFDRYAG